MSVTTIMLCGVGGQGTILAADLLAKVAASCGYHVKLSEVHGMAQRGGSVSTVVRFGDEVQAPITDAGKVDALVAFEVTEAARYLHFLKPDGALYVNNTIIEPLAVSTGECGMPANLADRLAQRGAVFVDAQELATAAGSSRSANVVLIGALSNALPFTCGSWEEVIANRVPPKTISANIDAFHAGRDILIRSGQ